MEMKADDGATRTSKLAEARVAKTTRSAGEKSAPARSVGQQRMGHSADLASITGVSLAEPLPWQSCCGLTSRGHAAGCDGRTSARSGDTAGDSNVKSSAMDAARFMVWVTEKSTPLGG